MFATVSRDGTWRKGTRPVTSVTRSPPPICMVAHSLAPTRFDRYSMWLANGRPARAAQSREMGAVTSALTLPATTASAAAAR